MSDETYSADPMHGGGDAGGHLDAGTVAAYLDDRLPAAKTVFVEAHLARCDVCRAEVVQLDAIVRPARVWPRPYFVGLGLAAAAALVLIVLPSRNAPSGVAADSASQTFRIRALGALTQPPIYLGVPVRAPSTQERERFANGMRAYTEARYTDAAALLKEVQAGGIDGAATRFFLGASLLMLDDAPGAADAFARVIDAGKTGYLAEAHYYRAKALLRMNQPDSAAVELDRSAGAGEETMKNTSRALQDSLRRARGR
ncbi:MAG TPA: zf-HC2 domain-containing protein [Gemmatimonadaceae bacterium]|nr:zf-HC2 domain-containing protein [Gemmatimonadaceae bacterium]